MKSILQKIKDGYTSHGFAVFENVDVPTIELKDAGFIEVQDSGESSWLIKLTPLGEEALEVESGDGKSAIAIDKDVPIPQLKRNGGRKPTYPYDEMEIGDSFHVPVTDENPDPGKKMASTTSSAINRYKQNVNGVLEKTKDFSVRRVDETDSRGPGVRVFRTA